MFAKSNNGRVLLNLGLVLVVLAVAGYFVLQRLQVTARVKVVNRDTAVDAVPGSVTIYADGGYRELKSEVPGKVIQVDAIDRTKKFKKNDPLVQLDTTDIDRQIAETKRTFETSRERIDIQLKDSPDEKVAEEALENAKRLIKIGAASQDQVNTAQRALDEVRKRMRLAEFDRKKLEADYDANMEGLFLTKKKMTIPAPMDGEVHQPLTFEGALIGAGQPVVTVFSDARIVSAKISEENISRVKLGQKARLRLLSQGNASFDAVVSKLLPTADETQRFEVWLDVKADQALLKPLSTGEVTITVDERPNQVVILRRALIDNESVYVVENGVVHRRRVQVGYRALNVVEILEGLKEGEHVIVDLLDEFREGQRVKTEIVK